MQKLTVIASIVVAASLSASCGDTTAVVTATGPTTLAIEPASFQLTSSAVVAKPAQTSFSFCPALAPFGVVLNLAVTAGTISLSVVELSARFIDTSGISTQQITLPAPVPTTQFGTALVQARQTRLFPLSLGFGCGTGRQGTATVVVVTRDQNGRMSTAQLSAFIR